MPAPLLIADVPWLLYRSFFALPRSIVDGEGRPVNALLGTVNAILAVIDARPRARRPRCVVACMGAEQADYRVRLYAAYHAHRDPMPAELRRAVGEGPGAAGEPRLDGRAQRRARGRRRDVLLRPRRAGARRAARCC